jgi:hypothetical protein
MGMKRQRYNPAMDFAAGLTVLKTASDLTTRVREALGSREVKLDEIVARIIEVQGLISDGRTALIDVQEQLLEKNREIFSLEQDNRKLQEQLSKKQQGRIHDKAAWKVLDDNSEEGPYCANCYEKTGNFIQPTRGALNDGSVSFFCTDHEKPFYFRVPVGICGELASDRRKPAPIRRPGPWS